MNKVLNKLKTINTLGMKRFYSSVYMIRDYCNKETSDYFCNEIIGNGFETKEEEYAKFVIKQNKNIMQYIIDTINPNDFGMQKVLSRTYLTNNIRLNTEHDVDFFLNLINSGYYLDCSKIFKYYLDNPERRENLNDILIKSKDAELGLYDFYKEKAIDNQNKSTFSVTNDTDCFISVNNILEIASNDIFLHVKAEDIRTIEMNRNRFSLSYSTMTLEEVEVLLNPLSEYIPKASKNNIAIVNVLKEYVCESDISKLADCDALFIKIEAIENLIDVLKELDNISLLNNIINACRLGFIQNEKDLLLVTNKIKYGEKFRHNRDFAYIVSGLKANSKTIKDVEYASLIRIKELVSKSFYKKLISDSELLKATIEVDVNLFKALSKILELGQLNKNQYEMLLQKVKAENLCVLNLSSDLKDYKLTFAELMELLNNTSYISGEELNKFKNLKPSERLLKIKDLIAIDKAIKSEEFMFKSEDIKPMLEDALLKNEFKNNNPLKFDNLVDYLNYRVMNSKINIESKEDYRKLILIENFIGIDKMNGMTIDEALLKCGCMDNMMSKMNLSDDFKTEYSKEIVKFFSSENFILLHKYLNNNKPSEAQKDSAILIAKSIIANKYEDLKFVYEDVLKEAGANISKESFDIWKRTDETTVGKYTVSDSSDFKYIMRMGEIPVRSCMHYENGAYSQCLLSNFDTTKKILTIHKNGKYVGRAILRLTKIADKNYTGSSDLKFLDVDSVNSEVAVAEDKKEKLIVFLEKAYTTLDPMDFKVAYKLMIEHLKIKTDSMGVELVASRFYSNCADETCKRKNKYVYITQSKNGQQYLDSFDGSTSNSKCYKSGEVLIY